MTGYSGYGPVLYCLVSKKYLTAMEMYLTQYVPTRDT